MSRRLKWPENTFEFGHRIPETHIIDELGVAIHGQSFPNGAVPQNLAQNYPEARGDLFNIGLLHTSANGINPHATYAPCSITDLTAKGYDYWALGHVHTRSILCESPPIVFPGNLQGRHINEPGARGFMLVTVEANHVQHLHFVPMDVLRWQRIEVDLSDAHSFDEALSLIGNAFQTAVSSADDRALAVRLVLNGATSLHGELLSRSDALNAECDALTCPTSGEIWLEQIQIETRPLVTNADYGIAGALASLVNRIATDTAEAADIRQDIDPGLQKIPIEIRTLANLEPFTDECFAGIIADAAALLRHRLTSKEKQS